eukprot:CAMPEP_0183379342 /NCGR_PEP_ID=MMETSP0164_2-20130417/125378_1 /TAXON_ID=221442 /ORGANISM="Coccolithus pelagicus ssp braarudi, Strain PLY182g" /LENGTH=127 /DNA_ID=CAMNT_0025556923 /DNA_START=570 /DNA_END=950 /DNA_ORIENTATION=+
MGLEIASRAWRSPLGPGDHALFVQPEAQLSAGATGTEPPAGRGVEPRAPSNGLSTTTFAESCSVFKRLDLLFVPTTASRPVMKGDFFTSNLPEVPWPPALTKGVPSPWSSSSIEVRGSRPRPRAAAS